MAYSIHFKAKNGGYAVTGPERLLGLNFLDDARLYHGDSVAVEDVIQTLKCNRYASNPQFWFNTQGASKYDLSYLHPDHGVGARYQLVYVGGDSGWANGFLYIYPYKCSNGQIRPIYTVSARGILDYWTSLGKPITYWRGYNYR